MRFSILLSFILFCCSTLQAANFKGFIEIEKGRSLYVDWKKADAGKPTLVLLNGLTYSTEYWKQFVQEIAPHGYGIFRYDPEGMGQTLLRRGAVHDVIQIENQARDLDLLTTKAGLTGKLHLLGLSYGGGLAIAFARDYPERVENAILMAPFTQPLAPQDTWIRAQIAATRMMYPWNPATFDDLYAYFLRQNVYFVYPLAEPSLRDNDLKPEAVFQMTQGIRRFDMINAAQSFPSQSVHLIVAEKDQYIPAEVMEAFWKEVPKAARASRLMIETAEHKIPEVTPAFAAGWVDMILKNDSRLKSGKSFRGNPEDGKIGNWK